MVEQTNTARVERIKPQVWTPEFKLHVPHKNGKAVFAYPGFGPNTYNSVGSQILEKIPGKDLKVPTGDLTASLLYSVYCDPNAMDIKQFENVRELMRESWLWVFNRNVFTEDGVYIVQDKDAKGIGQPNISWFESRLEEGIEREGIRFSPKGEIRFVPKDTYKFGEHTHSSLAEDGFIRASYGFEGAEKLGEFSSKIGGNPYVYGVEVDKGDSPVERVSALSEYDGGLHVVGIFDDDERSLAFGVFETCKAGAKK